jgi:hypothetical protein
MAIPPRRCIPMHPLPWHCAPAVAASSRSSLRPTWRPDPVTRPGATRRGRPPRREHEDRSPPRLVRHREPRLRPTAPPSSHRIQYGVGPRSCAANGQNVRMPTPDMDRSGTRSPAGATRPRRNRPGIRASRLGQPLLSGHLAPSGRRARQSSVNPSAGVAPQVCGRPTACTDSSVTAGFGFRIIGLLSAITHRAKWRTVGYRSDHLWFWEALKNLLPICSHP